jgi:hypothetical protein
MRECYVPELTRAPGAGGARALDQKHTHALHLHMHAAPIWIWWAIGMRAHVCARRSLSLGLNCCSSARSNLNPSYFRTRQNTALHINLNWCGACKIKLKMQKQELKCNRIQTYIRRLHGTVPGTNASCGSICAPGSGSRHCLGSFIQVHGDGIATDVRVPQPPIQ